METVDEEFTKEALRFMTDAKKSDKPFFLWWNATRMHICTHLKKESEGKTGLGTYPDGMVEHDAMVGQLLDKLKELGLDENTIVMYSTDNGAEKFTWPDGGTSPFRGEKNTNWEGGYRVPCAIRWPGVIKPGTINNDIFAHEDMLPTLLAAAGVPDVKQQLLKGMKVGNKTFKVHLDGYNITDALAGKAPDPRHEFFYFNDDGSLVGLRYNQWKIVFAEQRAEGFDVWQEPFVQLRLPKLFNLRSDPFEIGDREAMDYGHWRIDRVFLLVPAQQYMAILSHRSRISRQARSPVALALIRCLSAAGRPSTSSAVAIDVSDTSLRHTRELKHRHNLDNLEVHQLSIERVEALSLSFDLVLCTGVLHHLPDPDRGLRAQREALNPLGAMRLMVYAPCTVGPAST